METKQFWQFSDQLREQGSNFSHFPSNSSICSNSYKKTDDRKNFDARVGGKLNSNSYVNYNNNNTYDASKGKAYDWNGFNDGWKITIPNSLPLSQKGFSPNGNGKVANGQKKGKGDEMIEQRGKAGRKNSNKKNSSLNGDNNADNKSALDKRFKTLPQSEALPRNETVGGYIFVCNNDTMQENLKRQLFGLPPRYRDSVRAITPGLPLFLYNYSTHQLHGVYEAASFGGSNIDPRAWEDKKSAGESRFPAQVRVVTRKTCDPLEEDAFRPILHHYDGPKFRLELSVPEALSLLDIFAEQRV